MLKKINATGNPGCTLFNSECTISAKNTLRIGPAFCNDNIILFCVFSEYITAVSLKIVDFRETLFPDPDFAPAPAGQWRIQMGVREVYPPPAYSNFCS